MIQVTGASAETQILCTDETGSVPNLPLVQSVSMSNVCIPKTEGGSVGQAFLQPSPVVPQISPSVPQQYLQVKKMIIYLYKIKKKTIFTKGRNLNIPADVCKMITLLYSVRFFPNSY